MEEKMEQEELNELFSEVEEFKPENVDVSNEEAQNLAMKLAINEMVAKKDYEMAIWLIEKLL